MKEILRFLREARVGYLIFTSLIILGVFFGLFELTDRTLLSDTSQQTMQWLYFSRGVVVSLVLMVWAAWTVYKYRKMYEKKIQTTQGYYRDIVTHSADAIAALDVDGTITSWNRGAEKMLGWKPEEIVGEPVEKIIPEKLLEEGELDRIQNDIYSNGEVINYETKRLHKNGDKVIVSLTESLIRTKSDEIIGRSKILRDLTDVKMREEQIQQSERLATVGHMAAGVAHEVGNPLTAISSLVQVCQRKTDDEFLQGQLKQVRENIQRINKIVRDLVDFSRPSSRKKKTVQVNELINSAVGLLQHDARCRDVEFKLTLSDDLPAISSVPDQIHQVLVNLLMNAVDAMEDTNEPRVTVSTEKKNNAIMLTVTDIGTGITEENQSHIFEPFYTTKEVGSGTGLGLSVSHGIVNKMDGDIWVESEFGKGTTFFVELPINADEEQHQVNRKEEIENN